MLNQNEFHYFPIFRNIFIRKLNQIIFIIGRFNIIYKLVHIGIYNIKLSLSNILLYSINTFKELRIVYIHIYIIYNIYIYINIYVCVYIIPI